MLTLLHHQTNTFIFLPLD